MPPRVVADTNVIISALHAGGKPDAVLRLAHRGEIELYLSPFLLQEVVTVLEAKFGWPSGRILDVIRGLPGLIIEPEVPPLDVVADTADNRILECALACEAQYLVTGDRHLLDLGAYQGITILTPAEFLKKLAGDA